MKTNERRPGSSAPEAHPVLFDLPLDPGEDEAQPTPRQRPTREESEAGAARRLPLFDTAPATDSPAPTSRRAAPRQRSASARPPATPVGPPRSSTAAARSPRPIESDPGRGDDPHAAPVGRRVLSGLVDVAMFVLWTAVLGVVAVRLIASSSSVVLGPETWAPLVLAGALFSLVYTVLALALWRRTPGMMFTGLLCAGEDRDGVSVGQAARRWIAGVLTVAGLGLPAALLWTGRSLADRLSGSRVQTTAG